MLELKMKGYPRPDIKWMKDGKPIKAGDRFKFVNPDPETVALIISNIEPSDEGKYEVELANDLGEAKTEGKLTICGAPIFKEPIGNQVRLRFTLSFARIFYRNSVDGAFLLPIEIEEDAYKSISEGDELDIDISANEIKNNTKNQTYKMKPFSEIIGKIIAAGGLFKYKPEQD